MTKNSDYDMLDEDFGKNSTWLILPSPIQGIGVFARRWLFSRDLIGIGIVYSIGFIPRITFFGSKINHSYKPNAILLYDDDMETWNVYAMFGIAPGTEITLDYRDTPPFIAGPESHYV
jgi:hypothetical protein